MNIRELLARHGAVTIAASVIVIVSAVFFATRSNSPGGHSSSGPATKAFYTTDDGTTLFTDDADKVPPFDHDGKPAVRAKVFTCDGGSHHWVQYLEQYADGAALAAATRAPASSQRDATINSGLLLVKRPGDPTWTPTTDRDKIADICIPKKPEGMSGGDIHVWNPR